tara:strand:- start:1295 stop:2008 length:714 start_codon:yes stop_codon:yes gene_type:complete
MRDPLYFRRFDYDRRLLPNAYLASLEEGVSSIDAARQKSGLSIGYPGWSLIYNLLLGSVPPGGAPVLMETGTNWGASTIIIAQALADIGGDGVVHTFELNPAVQDVARRNIAQSGLSDRVIFHLGDSQETVPAFLESFDGELAGAFLDGAHEASVLLAEFEAVRPKLRRGALVFMDNTYPIAEPEKGDAPRVNQALPDLVSRHGGSLLNLPFVSWFTPGLAVWQGETPLDEGDWRLL